MMSFIPDYRGAGVSSLSLARSQAKLVLGQAAANAKIRGDVFPWERNILFLHIIWQNTIVNRLGNL